MFNKKILNKISIIDFLIYTVFLLLVGLSIYNSLRFRFTVDDAYIGIRYARHFVEGSGLVYNIGERVEGYSDFLWIILLSFFGFLGFNFVSAAHFLGLFSSVLTLILVFKLANKINPHKKYYNLIPITFLANNVIYTEWATGGLETSFFTLLLFIFFYRFYIEIVKNRNSLQLSAIIAVLLILTRPDGIFFIVVYFLFMLFVFRHQLKEYRYKIFTWIAIFLILYLPYTVWRVSYYGDIIPNYVYNKVNKLHYFSRGWLFFKSFLIDSYFYLWLIPPLFFFRFKNLFVNFVVLSTLIFILFTIWVGGDWMGYRFYRPILPPLLLIFGLGMYKFFEMRKYNILGTNTLRIFALLFLIITFILSSKATYDPHWRPTNFTDIGSRFQINIPEKKAIEIADAYEKLLDPDDVLAGTFAGYPAVYTDNRYIDMLGLTDKFVAKLEVKKPGMPGHEKWAPRSYLEENNVFAMLPGVEYHLGSKEDPRYYVKYDHRKYFVFESFREQDEIVKKFTSKGFRVFYRGRELFDYSNLPEITNNRNFDFELGNYLFWHVEGEAFSTMPSENDTWSNSPLIKNFQGRYFVNSFYGNSDKYTGKLISEPFVLEGDFLIFRIGGGRHEGLTAINLIIDEKIVRTETGENSEVLEIKSWNITEFKNKTARIEIVDNYTGDWGHILVDDIRQIKFA